ncbi:MULTISPECIES: MmgE/PrpD family protein [unclassified Ensifer]|uniref:MmgE/PrpD family protein n=1 Tax=unclassified Ensifer TaxID=2633371 RepID=UPI000812DBA1|nr:MULTISPECIES: MmgE/PrpD family protein [unclassified Ensifer]OCP18749.1 2-methylcitrate dehydratase [Ensifer sp. LC384]OCP19738.1 2-methylcitrate dehydratase [Ensifer sp. LC54]
MADTVLESLARNVAATVFDDFPEATVRKAKLHVLDTFGVAVAGSASGETCLTLAALGVSAPSGSSAIWGTPLLADARTAALVNGVSAHALELDDSGGCDHSGAVVLPAAVAALGEMTRQVHGREFLKSVLIGYEVGRRVLEAAGGYETHNGLGWHSTGTCGAFGAAAAVGTLLGLDAERIASALGLACSFTGGTWAFIHDGSPAKKLHAGRAAEGGLLAARFAANGFVGPGGVFDVHAWGSFFQAFCRGEGEPAMLVEGFGENWRIERCSIKPHATCRGTHSAIDAVDKLLGDHGLASEDVTAITVDMSGFQFGMCGGKALTSRAQVQMSLPYAIAARLQFGKVSLPELEERAWRDPSIDRWLQRIDVRIDPTMLDEAEPAVALATSDGRHLKMTIDFPLGSPANPLSDDRLIGKYNELAGSVFGRAKVDGLRDRVLTLDRCTDVRELLEWLH